ncbi:hypothetical protein SUGI_0006760 [Cryptomeria japonica]|uniref:17.8 kDa class I heat shock protein n=1 Tax=Cryptomeria japonica TaxID=3369 RepID=UPI002408BAAF|nr:17.8 kDa class I heat shock protein [Cryptomeria japonica]GLJ04925.1 hypothetical protein SUGI_0006760 [Cryptomeria japonica]
MSIVPVYARSGENTDIQPWGSDPLGHGWSSWNSFCPFRHGRWMEPSEAFPQWDHSASSLFSKDAHAMANTHIDWWESADAHIIEADLPGVSKDEVEVLVENGSVLQISGRSRNRATPPGGEFRCRRGERCKVGYLKRIRIPHDANTHQLKAELENGVLTVTIPKFSSSDEVRIVEIQE